LLLRPPLELVTDAMEHRGHLVAEIVALEERPSFSDFRNAGWRLALMAAVDFTSSNGDISDASGLDQLSLKRLEFTLNKSRCLSNSGLRTGMSAANLIRLDLKDEFLPLAVALLMTELRTAFAQHQYLRMPFGFIIESSLNCDGIGG
jgi:hypothetical protein